MVRVFQTLMWDLYGCSRNLVYFNDIEHELVDILSENGLKIVDKPVVTDYGSEDGHGFNFYVPLRDSAFIIYTWPEKKLTGVTLELCSEGLDEDGLCDDLKRFFDAKYVDRDPDPKKRGYRWEEFSGLL